MIFTLLLTTTALVVGHALADTNDVAPVAAAVRGGIGHKFCCGDCASAQRQGAMEWGTSCNTCAAPTRPRSAIGQCEPLAYDERKIDHFAARAQTEGITDPALIALRVLEAVYPTTPSGEPINWGLVGPGWDHCLRMLKACVYSRCYFLRGFELADEAMRAWRSANYPEVQS